MLQPSGIPVFERFFREAAGLEVSKADFKRYREFINHEIYDLLLRGQAMAKANGRDVIQPYDLPITKGLQEMIQQFHKLGVASSLEPIMDSITARPPLDLAIAAETEERFPEIDGGLSLALARTFKLVDPDVKHPLTRHWELAFQIFDLLL